MTIMQSDKETFDLEVARELGYLFNEGYQYLGASVTSTPALGEYLEAVFANPASHREVRVNYLPSVSGYPDALNVFLEDGKNDSFALDDFLKYRDVPAALISTLSLSSYHGSFQERVCSCLTTIKSVMNEYLDSIVSGRDWTHVPLDWGDYK